MSGSAMHGAARSRWTRLSIAVALIAALAIGVAGVAGAASKAAKDAKATIKVVKPWARTSPMEAKNGAVYMVLKNTVAKDNALVGASVPSSVAMETEIHETKMGAGGTMMMSEVSEITLGGKSSTNLEPGGYHVMLMNLMEPLEVGSKIKVTLEFENGPKQTVKAVVKG